MNLAIQRFTMPGSSSSFWKSTGAGVPNQFPAGLRVLVVDDDPTCLVILEKMLKNCNYEATICNRAEIGLSLLREKKNGYDIVLSDVHMPDMDGFKFLEHIGLEMDLPVIMMSADDSNSVVMKGVTHGACDYLIKPVRIEALRNIWQHVVRRRKHEWKDFEPLSSADDTDPPQQKVLPQDVDNSSSANDGRNWKNVKRRKDDEEDEAEEREESSSSLKKPRVVWSIELHQQFVAAVNQLGIDKAVPKKILELMNVPGLTRENVASHLQKYRLYLRRLSGSQLGSINTSFLGSSGAGYGSMSSLNGLDLQAGGDQFPGPSLATLQAPVMGRSHNSKSLISMPFTDQRNMFSFENSKLRYGEVQTPHLLHGIPTNMEPKQFVGLHQSRQHSFTGANSKVLVPMGGQTQTRSQSLQNGNHHVPVQLASPDGMLSYGLGTKVSRSEIVPSCDMMNNVNLNRPHDPGFQDNTGTFNDASSLYSSCKKFGPTVTFSADLANYNGIENNLMSAKAESLLQFPEQYNQDDPLTAILNQPPQQQQRRQEGFGQPENEFGFDGHIWDDLSA